MRRGVGGGAHSVPSVSALRTVGRASASAQTVRAAWARLRPFSLTAGCAHLHSVPSRQVSRKVAAGAASVCAQQVMDIVSHTCAACGHAGRRACRRELTKHVTVSV